ncbi:hypothetical protein [Nocardia sp. GTS18]|uniref:hypothetical protein n=1 Tax=Nocardia sp. GTS18 TaxID=1778064 RepID=UPI0015EE4F12|nr:hypothetical protein [Nocardia sp. GTS18]
MSAPPTANQRRVAEKLILGSVIDRIDARFERAAELHRWGTNPHKPEAGSVMAADEAGFLTAFSSNPVMWMASYPISMATESMGAAGYMFSQRHETGKTRLGPVLAECRAALEAASRAVWLLSPVDRQERRDRITRAMREDARQEAYFLENLVAVDPGDRQAATRQAKQATHLAGLRAEAAVLPKMIGFLGATTEAGEWLVANPPPHARDLVRGNLHDLATMLYSLTSGFTHGLPWTVDYGRDGGVFSMVSDAIACAVLVTESAIALYESQAQQAGRERLDTDHFPERLRPSIDAWSKLYTV